MSTTPSSSNVLDHSGGLVQTMRRHPVISFFVLAYAIPWALWIPVLVLHLPTFDPSTHAPTLYILAGIAIGVTGSAFLMTAVTQGKAGVLRLLRRFVLWRVGWQWYAVAILMIPITEVLIGLVLPGGQDALRAFSPAALLAYPAAYLSHFYFGPLFEEAGWRGFALPRLQHRYGPLVGTLILGFFWGVWHLFLYLPIFLEGGDFVGGLVSSGSFVLLTIGLSYVFTWLFNNTQGSLLLAILLHGSVDGTATYLQVLAERHLLSATAAANIVGLGNTLAPIALGLLLIVFTRGRLSYERYQHEAEQLDLAPSLEQKPASPGAAV
jgi:membrane protease YdiL (CAAX protease family)